MEAEQERLQTTLADPAFYRDRGDEVAAVQARLGELEGGVAAAYERWQELDALPE